jgi:Zn ribbon nucleic-acid-binding protein
VAIYHITELFPRRLAPQARTRKTLRIWCEGHLLSYNCVRCGIAGYAINNRAFGQKRFNVYLKVRAQIARVAGQPVIALALLL